MSSFDWPDRFRDPLTGWFLTGPFIVSQVPDELVIFTFHSDDGMQFISLIFGKIKGAGHWGLSMSDQDGQFFTFTDGFDMKAPGNIRPMTEVYLREIEFLKGRLTTKQHALVTSIKMRG